MRVGASVATAVFVVSLPLGVRAAETNARVRAVATIDGRDLRVADNNHPIRLSPGKIAKARLRITNRGSRSIVVRSARVEGRVIGLTFFSYETALEVRIPARKATSVRFNIDLVGLRGQATGLLPARLTLVDRDGHTLTGQSFTADVRGSLVSVYGLFGLAVLIFTGLTFTAVLLGLVRHRLPPNRMRRALRFSVPGFGLGLTVTFTLSAFRIVAPRANLWLPLVIGGGIAGLVVGYLSPTPETGEVEEQEAGGEATTEDGGEATAAGTTTTAPGRPGP